MDPNNNVIKKLLCILIRLADVFVGLVLSDALAHDGSVAHRQCDKTECDSKFMILCIVTHYIIDECQLFY